MSQAKWLQLSSALLRCEDRASTASLFLDSLVQGLGINDAMLLIPSLDGRRLNIVDTSFSPEQGALSADGWLVDDFSHPFSHIVQSGKARLLKDRELQYWRDNKAFSEVLAQMADNDSAWIGVVRGVPATIAAVLFFSAPAKVCQGLNRRRHWRDFCQVFARHWQLLDMMGQHQDRHNRLTDSITALREDSHRHELLRGLDKVLIGNSQIAAGLRADIVKVARSELTVMLQGETGTGKELVARAVHDCSHRGNNCFIAINCAAIPENLLESELFGYRKGAFSGAEAHKQGLIAAADGGTLFLDEIGDMPLSLQAKLLRVLETHSFRALGSCDEVRSDFRLIVATHVDLKSRLREGGFRQDLFYRLCQFPLNLAPLRQRLEDLPALVDHFIAAYNARHNRNITGVRYTVIDVLRRHRFRGNLRELRNIVEYACALTEPHREIELAVLPELELSSVNSMPADAADKSGSYPPMQILVEERVVEAITDLKATVLQFERQVICSRLRAFQGSRVKAARSLGIPKRTLAHKCQKLQITEF